MSWVVALRTEGRLLGAILSDFPSVRLDVKRARKEGGC